MIIYLDILIILNFIVNYCFMKLIYIIFHEKIKTIRLIISSSVSIILLFSFFTNYIIFTIIKIFGGVLLVFISFNYSNHKRFIIMTSLYYLLQFSFIGVLNIFNVHGCSIFAFLLLICLLIIIYSQKSHIYDKKTYKVIIKLVDEIIEIDGFLDTGNMACYYDKPIIFLDKKYYSNKLTISNVIKLRTVNDEQYINCYKPKEFYVLDCNKKISKDVLIAFSSFNNDVNCLLNNLLFN